MKHQNLSNSNALYFLFKKMSSILVLCFFIFSLLFFNYYVQTENNSSINYSQTSLSNDYQDNTTVDILVFTSNKDQANATFSALEFRSLNETTNKFDQIYLRFQNPDDISSIMVQCDDTTATTINLSYLELENNNFYINLSDFNSKINTDSNNYQLTLTIYFNSLQTEIYTFNYLVTKPNPVVDAENSEAIDITYDSATLKFTIYNNLSIQSMSLMVANQQYQINPNLSNNVYTYEYTFSNLLNNTTYIPSITIEWTNAYYGNLLTTTELNSFKTNSTDPIVVPTNDISIALIVINSITIILLIVWIGIIIFKRTNKKKILKE